jgi:regulator of cell morphogenesis and NO signaling
MTITETTTIADIARELPTSIRVFQQRGIDFCCGGRQAIGAVCQTRGLDLPEVIQAIEGSAAMAADDTDWSRQPLGALIDHIVSAYHRPLQEELTRLESMAATVAHAHGTKAPELARIEAIVTELAADLRLHMRKEEMVLFPAIKALEAGVAGLPIPISAPITVMEHEHEYAGELLAELRLVSHAYGVPEWGCATWRGLYQGLTDLESVLHVHVHLENNVLFPRALELDAHVTAERGSEHATPLAARR